MNALNPLPPLSDATPREYGAAVNAATSLVALREVLTTWRSLANDAYQVAQNMTDDDWLEYVKGRKLESRNIFAGKTWYQNYKAILFPEVMFQVSMIAVETESEWDFVLEALLEKRQIILDSENIHHLVK